ncbi:hypothetical protein [Maribacter sp. 2-571]|uniref:hypothetical protein n=1 Tax=Maribacter sp. 2-571 TaxID=3417569 RepID=UPI003D336D3F
MLQKKGNNTISIFFLLTFLILGIVKVHAYSHFAEHDGQTHCELCAMVVSTDTVQTTLDGGFEESHTRADIIVQTFTLHFAGASHHYCITLPEQLHNKPPPTP